MGAASSFELVGTPSASREDSLPALGASPFVRPCIRVDTIKAAPF